MMLMRRKKKNNSLGIISSILIVIITFFARRILAKSYTKIMGQKPPKSGDKDQPLGQVLTWTAVSTIAMSLLESLLQKNLKKKN